MIRLPEPCRSPLAVSPSGRPPYEVYVSRSWLDSFPTFIASTATGRVFLVSQQGLEGQASQVRSVLAPALGSRLHTETLFLRAGESHKSLAELPAVYDTLIDWGADRRSLLVAVGGGTVGDLVGFVAATLVRGIDFVQVPTTLLAAVDASVGGKTGVNVSRGKNMVGAFHQPRLVYFYLGFLRTLSAPELICGLAEMFKHALLEESGRLLADLEAHAPEARSRDSQFLEQAVTDSIAVKAAVVAMDERELGPRAALNLGHTTAHAIESLTGYVRFSHGEAVSRGLVTMLLLSRDTAGLPEKVVERLLALMERLGLPRDTAGLGPEQVSAHLKYDKKSVDGASRFVLLSNAGAVLLGRHVSQAQFEAAWSEQARRFG